MKWLAKMAALAALSGVLVSVTACGSADTKQDQAALQGSEWRLAQSSVATLQVGLTDVTAAFDGKQVSGSSGVNRYSGGYTADADGAFSTGPLAGTLMAGPEEHMQLESAYLRMLEAAETFAIEGDRLTLTTGEGETLVFDAMPAPELSGSSWLVNGYNNGKQAVVGMAPEPQLTLEFSAGGQVSGNAGVNTYSGSYEYDEGTISIGTLATTKIGGPEELMEQERLYLAALQASVSWEVVSDVLYLRDAQDAIQVTALAPE